jgi:hypothetical protein
MMIFRKKLMQWLVHGSRNTLWMLQKYVFELYRQSRQAKLQNMGAGSGD